MKKKTDNQITNNNTRAGRPDSYMIMMIISGIFFLALHLTFVGFTNDDAYFKVIREDFDSLFSIVLDRYLTDSSRVLSEAILFTLIRMPFIVWQLLDTLICLLATHSAAVILTGDRKDKKNYLVFLLFACYPYMHMGSAGWICTSLNYIWPMAAFLYALSGAVRRYRGEKVSGNQYRLYVLALIFAANCEQSAVVVMAAFATAAVFAIIDKKSKWYEITGTAIGLFGLVFAMTAPGNGARTEMEAVNWMPEFFDLTLIDKARLCGVFVFEHYVMIPDVIFFLFSVLILFAGLDNKKRSVKIVSAIPVLIDVVFTSVYFVKDFIIGHKTKYDFTTPAIYMNDAHTAFVQLSEAVGLIIYIAATLYVLWNVFENVRVRNVSIVALGTGFAVRMALMLSPTMFASWHRVLIYLYFAFLGDSYLLAERFVFAEEKEKPVRRKVICAVLIAGILVNLVLTVGLQIRKAG